MLATLALGFIGSLFDNVTQWDGNVRSDCWTFVGLGAGLLLDVIITM